MIARHLPRLFAKLFCSPILMETGTRMAFETMLLNVMLGEGSSTQSMLPIPDARKADPQQTAKRAGGILEAQGDTAIIHIDGALDRHLDSFDLACFDATDVNDVMNAARLVGNDPAIANVLLYFNSPGGSVAGIPETAAMVQQLAEKKNVFAYTDGMMCSAAYWIAAQCDQIFANPSARVGSIGVYQAILQASDSMEKMGRKIETIQSGKLKTAGAYWKPLTADERAHLQAEVDQIGADFRGAVTAKRPQVQQASMEGQSMMGSKAVGAGLIDATRPDLASVLAEFRR